MRRSLVEGRHILDSVGIANKVLDNRVHNKISRVICKLDIEKLMIVGVVSFIF